MGFKVKQNIQSRFKVKKQDDPIQQRFDFLIANVSKLKNQRFVDAIESMVAMYKKMKKLTPDQIAYIDFLIEEVKTKC